MSGRQKEFDKLEALSAAMRVFWKKGYSGASLSELCSAMAINKPSMYATFGNKEALFVHATDHYLDQYAKPLLSLLDGDESLVCRLRRYLRSAVSEQCSEKNPPGCYVALCVAESASEILPSKASAKVAEARDFGPHYFRDFFTREQKLGYLSKPQDVDQMAFTVMTLLHGTASMARGGASVVELYGVVEMVLKALGVEQPESRK